MYPDLDTEAFLAYAKARHQELLQQAKIDALQRSGVLRQQGRTHQPRHRPALWHLCRNCWRAVHLGGQTLWQRWSFVSRSWASGNSAQAPRTNRG
jgi:hypothetical protein